MSLFYSMLSPEKVAAIERGENVKITAEDSTRFQLAFAEAQRSQICQTPCLFRSTK